MIMKALTRFAKTVINFSRTKTTTIGHAPHILVHMAKISGGAVAKSIKTQEVAPRANM